VWMGRRWIKFVPMVANSASSPALGRRSVKCDAVLTSTVIGQTSAVWTPNPCRHARGVTTVVSQARTAAMTPTRDNERPRSTHCWRHRSFGKRRPHHPYQHLLGVLADKLADCGLSPTDAATVRAQELSNRPTDDDHEH
jgi:hypothetical protein